MNKITSLVFAIFFLFALVPGAAASVTSFEKLPDAVLFTLDKGFLKIKICSNDIIEVKYTALDSFLTKPSLVVSNHWPMTASYTVKEVGPDIVITTPRLIIRVSRATQSITYLDASGNFITAEDDREGKTMTPHPVAGIDTWSCGSRWASPSDEALYGLGCHPMDSLSINYKGRDQDMLIKYLTGAIPVMLSTKGYGLLWDNYSASRFYGAEDGNTKFRYVSESGRQLDY
jgi:alpha-D-xyloside xylohydrolase